MRLPRVFGAISRRLRLASMAALRPLRLAIYELPAYDHHRLSFAQEGEDLILARMLEEQPPGTFVDVGAHHPQRFSNTYALYLAGWRGVNIDATPGSMAAFRALRPDDVNVEAGVSEDGASLTYYCFNEPALNTFSAELAESRDGLHSYRIIERRVLPTYRLETLLAEHLPAGRPVDVLTVDVEGLELQVLRSADWTRFHPAIVVVEIFGCDSVRSVLESPTAQFLGAHGYELVAQTANTSFFRRHGALAGR